jgi:hypothetical protein
MPDEQLSTNDPAAQEPAAIAYEPVDGEERDEWLDEPDELPPRPRRRLLGVGGNPIPLALLGVLLIAGGFIAGVQVQKGEETSSASSGGATASLASRFAALRGGGTTGAGANSGKASTGAATGGFAGTGAGGGRPTTGTVAYLAGNTLYVTTAEGNTVKVMTSAASAVTKTVTASVKGIHPGETVVITGTAGAKGVLSAESIRVGASAGSGGLGALFGGSGASASGSASKGGSGASSSEPALFGKGG